MPISYWKNRRNSNLILGTIALWNHGRKSNHPLKDYLSSSDFNYYLAVEDGYINSISRWWFCYELRLLMELR